MDIEQANLNLHLKITALDRAMKLHGVGFADSKSECEEILVTAEKIEKYLTADILTATS